MAGRLIYNIFSLYVLNININSSEGCAKEHSGAGWPHLLSALLKGPWWIVGLVFIFIISL